MTSKSVQKRLAAQLEGLDSPKPMEKVNPLPAMSDEDLYTYAREMASIGGMQDEQAKAFEELVARYENAKMDLNDYSEI